MNRSLGRNSTPDRKYPKPKRRSLAALSLAAIAAIAITAELRPSFLSSIQCLALEHRELLSGAGRSPQGELPASAVLIALGHDSKVEPLQGFADRVSKDIGRRVVTYRQFESAHFTSEKGNWWDRLSYGQTTAVVEQALRHAVARYPNLKVIAFNLDGYNPKELFGPSGEEIVSYTNFEVRLLLKDRRLYSATRWYFHRRELSTEEADHFWAPVIASLRSRQCVELLQHVTE